MPKVFVTRRVAQEALDRLASEAEVDLWPEPLPPPYEELTRRAAPCEGLLCMLTDRINGALLDACPSLRVVSQMAVGLDNVDLEAARSRGIAVGHTPGVLTETTAELALALMLAAARRLVECDRFVREGEWRTWDPLLLLGRDLQGSTLGILGLGRIGQAVAVRARAFGMRVLYWSRTRKPDCEARLGVEYREKDDLLRESDFVSLHTALTEETRGLVGSRELALMKPTAVLVNTSRGPVVDEAALAEALREGRIAHAALDVFEAEPLPRSSSLLGLTNVTLAPHVGSATVATRTKMALMAADNLLAGLRGEPLPFAALQRPEVG